MMGLKIIFAGTPLIAVATLDALIHSPHQVVAVYTQPDRKAGRGRKLQASPVKVRALEANIPVEQPESLRDKTVCQQLSDYQADLMVVVAYGLLLPENVLKTPKQGCINVHFSLLPRWRGAAPVQHAILHGDAETGVSIIKMVKALDAGDILAMEKVPITESDTSQSLSDKLSVMGANLLCKTLSDMSVKPKAQDKTEVTYASKIQKQDALIDWHQKAVDVDRKVRAYAGWPVAFTAFKGEALRIWQTRLLDQDFNQKAGTFLVLDKAVIVTCGEGAVVLEKVQFAGKRIISGAEMRSKFSC